jgi:hypothetical protein
VDRLVKLLNAKKQTGYWMWWGRISPLFFLLGAFMLYEIVHTDIPFIFYASWVIFITVSLVWWGWVLKIILDFIKFFADVNVIVLEIKDEVVKVQKDVKDLKTKE